MEGMPLCPGDQSLGSDRMRTPIAVLSTTVLWVLASVCLADDLTKLSTTQLIERLVSRNAEPKGIDPGKERQAKPPPTYESKHQDSVYEAWNELLKRDDAEIATLVKSVRDRRYSVTEDAAGFGMVNLSAGEVCARIISAKLDVHRQFTRQPGLPSYTYDVILAEPHKWLESHKDIPLLELQQQSIHWWLQQESDDVPAKLRTKVRESHKLLLDTQKPFTPKEHRPEHRF